MASSLKGKIAIVTGASRGAGKGAALGLGEAGATVYVTGRTVSESGAAMGTISQTAHEIDVLGGQGIGVQCDHTDDVQVEALFQRIRREQGRLDILVNNVYPVTELPAEIKRSPSGRTPIDTPFWQLPVRYWDALFTVSLRSHYVASSLAAPMMIDQGGGLIVNVSGGQPGTYIFNVPASAEKAAYTRLTIDMAQDLRPHGIPVVMVRPPVLKSELVMAQAAQRPINLTGAVWPILIGRCIAALAASPTIAERSGQALTVREMAKEFGLLDE